MAWSSLKSGTSKIVRYLNNMHPYDIVYLLNWNLGTGLGLDPGIVYF